jgi:hypothetical protein
MGKDAMTRFQSISQCFTEVLQQMPSIGHLNSVRSGPACCFGVGAGTVAADYLYTWMSVQPSDDGICFPVRQKINHFTCFQITQNGSIAIPLAPRPIVDPHHPGRVFRLSPLWLA